MKANRTFPDDLLAILKESKGVRIRAGAGDHRFIGIWFVVVKQRVFARSWSVKPKGWYRTFLSEPQGAIRVGKTEVAVCAVPTKSKALKDAVDLAYLGKYNATWELKYTKGLTAEKCRAATVEIVPGN